MEFSSRQQRVADQGLLSFTYTVRPQGRFSPCDVTGHWKQRGVEGFKAVVRRATSSGSQVVYQAPRTDTQDEAHTLAQEFINSMKGTCLETAR